MSARSPAGSEIHRMTKVRVWASVGTKSYEFEPYDYPANADKEPLLVSIRYLVDRT